MSVCVVINSVEHRPLTALACVVINSVEHRPLTALVIGYAVNIHSLRHEIYLLFTPRYKVIKLNLLLLLI